MQNEFGTYANSNRVVKPEMSRNFVHCDVRKPDAACYKFNIERDNVGGRGARRPKNATIACE